MSIRFDRFKTTGHIEGMSRPSLKEQILDAAVETFHRNGFNATSVQDITEAAGVPKGSFYNHFKTKEDLAVDALDRYWQRVLGSLSILDEADTPPVARLKRYFRHLAGVARKHHYQVGCMIGNMSAELADHSPQLRARLAAELATWTRAIEACVAQAQDDGSLRDDIAAGSIAAFLLNAWEGAVIRAKVDRTAASLDAFEAVVFTSLAS
jgi:TetR/AcrR family transcriptional repressor of nem operon